MYRHPTNSNKYFLYIERKQNALDLYVCFSVLYRAWRISCKTSVLWNWWDARWICVYLHIILLRYAKDLKRWIYVISSSL